MPWGDRAAIFLKAADLISKKYRYRLIAATILGQGKNVWQAEIDAAAEVSMVAIERRSTTGRLYLCFSACGLFPLWGEVRRRALLPATAEELRGFVEVRDLSPCSVYMRACLSGFHLAVLSTALSRASSSQFRHSTSRLLVEISLAVRTINFSLSSCSLPLIAPALVGNVVLWKPSPAATYSNYIVHQILTEAGVPPGVIQFVPGPPPEVVAQAIAHREFAGLHFTGSTFVFKKLWKDIASNIDKYRTYPRIVGETGARITFSGSILEE
jgi:1-pyrroline-5-carboxylate dehydrogenase